MGKKKKKSKLWLIFLQLCRRHVNQPSQGSQATAVTGPGLFHVRCLPGCGCGARGTRLSAAAGRRGPRTAAVAAPQGGRLVGLPQGRRGVSGTRLQPVAAALVRGAGPGLPPTSRPHASPSRALSLQPPGRAARGSSRAVTRSEPHGQPGLLEGSRGSWTVAPLPAPLQSQNVFLEDKW